MRRATGDFSPKADGFGPYFHALKPSKFAKIAAA
jgi:hypothetical protein